MLCPLAPSFGLSLYLSLSLEPPPSTEPTLYRVCTVKKEAERKDPIEGKETIVVKEMKEGGGGRGGGDGGGGGGGGGEGNGRGEVDDYSLEEAGSPALQSYSCSVFHLAFSGLHPRLYQPCVHAFSSFLLVVPHGDPATDRRIFQGTANSGHDLALFLSFSLSLFLWLLSQWFRP